MRIAIVALSLVAFVLSAHAADVSECADIYANDAGVRRNPLVDYKAYECMSAQKILIERFERRFNATVEFIRDPLSIVRGINLDVMRKEDELGPKFTRMYEDLADRFGVDRNADQERFPVLRSTFSDPAKLAAFFVLSKPVLRESVRRFAVVGVVSDLIAQNAHVFKVPLATPVSAGAQEWYGNFCSVPDENDEDAKERCKKVDWFPKRFQEAYGVEVTRDAAKILSFLNRRYREGGMPLVAVWQSMGNEFLTD